MESQPKNLYEMLRNSAERYGQDTALTEIKKGKLVSISFSSLHSKALYRAKMLLESGIKPKSNVAISGPNSIDWVIGFFSIIYANCTVVPIDPKLNKQAVEFILQFTNASLIKNIPITETSEELPSPLIDEDSIAEILFTSGTTGDPKGVMLSHKNLISNLRDINQVIPFYNRDTIYKSFSILPLHHVYELTGGLLNSIYNGNMVHFCSKIDLATMSKEMKMTLPSIWQVVPLILEKIFKGIKKNLEESIIKRTLFRITPKLFGILVKRKLGLDKVKFILCGGAALNEEIERFLDRIGITIVQGYGLSEASPLISVNPPTKTKFGSVGRIIESCNIELRDKNEEGHGIIFAKGPNIFLGYYKNPESTNDVLKDGWLDTGDIGYLDDEDYLYITGREKFVIVNKGGKNIYPEEIEERLKTSSLVKDSVVFSKDDQNIIAIIQPEELAIEGKHLDEIKKMVYNHVLDINKQLESYKRVSKVYITENDFEKTSTQKIKRDFLKNLDINDYTLAN